jgi:hypothetical protein
VLRPGGLNASIDDPGVFGGLGAGGVVAVREGRRKRGEKEEGNWANERCKLYRSPYQNMMDGAHWHGHRVRGEMEKQRKEETCAYTHTASTSTGKTTLLHPLPSRDGSPGDTVRINL